MPYSFYDFVFEHNTAGGGGHPILVVDFKTVTIKLLANGAAGGTLHFVKSDQDIIDLPDFGSAQSETNDWEYVEVIDLSTGNPIDGATGTTVVPNDDRSFEFNTNGAAWIGAIWTSPTGEIIHLRARAFNQYVD